MNTIPIIRIEVERMRQTVCQAFSEMELKIDEDIQACLKEYCAPENLRRVISASVGETLNAVIKEEVNNFFRYGKGREVVKAAVIKRLEQDATGSVLDD